MRRKSTTFDIFRFVSFDASTNETSRGEISLSRSLKKNEYFQIEFNEKYYLISSIGGEDLDEYKCTASCYCIEKQEIERRGYYIPVVRYIGKSVAMFITGFAVLAVTYTASKLGELLIQNCRDKFSNSCDGEIDAGLDDCEKIMVQEKVTIYQCRGWCMDETEEQGPLDLENIQQFESMCISENFQYTLDYKEKEWPDETSKGLANSRFEDLLKLYCKGIVDPETNEKPCKARRFKEAQYCTSHKSSMMGYKIVQKKKDSPEEKTVDEILD